MIFIKLLALLFITNWVYAGVKDVYEFKWLDPKKKVFVLQNKLHKNKGYGNISLGYGDSLLSDFQDTRAIHFMADYYFSEEWGFEFFYSSYSNSNNSSYDAVQQDTGGSVIPHIVRFESLYGVNLMFSPFYAKVNTFNTIFYIDWNFGAGFALMNVDDNTLSFNTDNPVDFFQSNTEFGLSLKTQVRWHLTGQINIQMDYIFYFANLPEPTPGSSSIDTGMKRSRDIIFSLGYRF